ncbi:MAG: glycosyltransferase family 4 protein [Proteobacteria bacterium]|nr:MAG: glycosyltransferase family 4 protein [Pseudomonadota bacterium]
MTRLAVLSVADPLSPAGGETCGAPGRILALLDRALMERGHRSVVVAAEGSRVEGRLLATPRVSGSIDGAAQAAAQAWYRKTIREALAHESFDLVHMHGADFHTYLPEDGSHVLVTLHRASEFYAEQVFRLRRAGTWLHCVSRWQEVRCPAGAALLPFIESGIPVERFDAPVRRRNYALALGRIHPGKGFHLAFDAARRADTPLVLAGELAGRPHEEYFQRELTPRIKGQARFLGPVKAGRKRRLLAGARCLLAPCLEPEASSLVAMEALAAGTPVIAFSRGAMAEIVDHGRTGFLVKDVEEMARAIRDVDSIDPQECRAVARQRFSADRMTEQYLSRYDQLAGSPATHAFSAA